MNKMKIYKKASWAMDFTGQTIFWTTFGAVLILLVGILWLYISNNFDILERII